MDILAEVQRQHLPYTVIDVGWWTQQILFRLPSGRTNHGAFEIFQFIPGEGDVTVAITDIRDIGRYVAEIIADPRTLNKSVFAYTEVMTLNEMVKLQERISGEKIEVPRVSIHPNLALQDGMSVCIYTNSTCYNSEASRTFTKTSRPRPRRSR